MNNELQNSSNIPGLDYPLVCNLCYTEMQMTKKCEWVCPKCGSHAYQSDPEDPDSIYYENSDPEEYEDSYAEINEIPEGCRACGSDTYPMCREGCALIDL